MNILKIDNLSKNFGGVAAVNNFSLEQKHNTIVGIIGPNGAGKTTVFNLVSGIYSPDGGRLFFNGKDISNYPAHRRTKLGISRTFQNIRLFNNLTVLENLKVAYNIRVKYSLLEEVFYFRSVRKEEKKIDDLSFEMLKYFELSELAGLYPSNLPYGLQRRLELARALITGPKLLLLDEPAAGLNPKEVHDLIATIKRIKEERKLSIIVVEHHMELIMNMCEEIHVMDFGKKIAEGSPVEIKKNEKVLQAYLGDEN